MKTLLILALVLTGCGKDEPPAAPDYGDWTETKECVRMDPPQPMDPCDWSF